MPAQMYVCGMGGGQGGQGGQGGLAHREHTTYLAIFVSY